jgi:Zn-dependent protease with chaperone function
VPFPSYPDISPLAWEHPTDAAALATLRGIPGLDRVIGATLGRLNERAGGSRMLGNDAVQVTVDTHPRLHGIWKQVRQTLDAPDGWPLYVRPMGGINAATTGMDRPKVLVSEEALRQLHDGTLRAILAHEVGHILSGHIRFKSAFLMLASMGTATLTLGWTVPAYAALFAALRAWDRASELSADRAALLATGDIDAIVAPLSGHAPESGPFGMGWPTGGVWDRIAPVADRGLQLVRAHPKPDYRIKAIRKWHDSDDYKAIVDGHYPRRGDERTHAARWVDARAAMLRNGLLDARDRLWAGQPPSATDC